eukprot:CAMPEP_0179207478 /NCGR_PEP_ID=MMETSP0796-20121207/103460_1 /TAXON_ID=73915 /ORGANISM="Pyrodinium bahamense, Strain pbaha01" /LENGTH=48 /DNA_ID= /DNA_START= /DNA_END= /DNA_ORIENTATION=
MPPAPLASPLPAARAELSGTIALLQSRISWVEEQVATEHRQQSDIEAR